MLPGNPSAARSPPVGRFRGHSSSWHLGNRAPLFGCPAMPEESISDRPNRGLKAMQKRGPKGGSSHNENRTDRTISQPARIIKVRSHPLVDKSEAKGVEDDRQDNQRKAPRPIHAPIDDSSRIHRCSRLSASAGRSRTPDWLVCPTQFEF